MGPSWSERLYLETVTYPATEMLRLKNKDDGICPK
jgi:hypothetical protein